MCNAHFAYKQEGFAKWAYFRRCLSSFEQTGLKLKKLSWSDSIIETYIFKTFTDFLLQILSNFGHLGKLEKIPREVVNPNIQKDILWLEKQEGSMNFKFGVIYAKAGQIMDDELFSNESGSQNFTNFLSLLGERVTLKGWPKFRGGLDIRGNMTGQHSMYTTHEEHEIMFHVSTMLPFSADDRQQVSDARD